MGKPRKAKGRTTPPPEELGARIARIALAAALAGTALVVDSGADSSFDAPKRLVSLLCIAGAAAGAFAMSPRREGSQARPWRRGPLPRRLALFFLAAALAASLLAALLSPRREASLDSARALLLYSLLLPLGASRALEKPKALLAVFLAATAGNAAVSLLQAGGGFQPFALKTWGGREATGAFVGNVGYLALSLALAAVAALGIAIPARSRPLRIAAGSCAFLFLGAMLVNQNLTAFLSLAVGATVLFAFSYGKRALLPAAALLLLLGIGVTAYRPLRQRAFEAGAAARAGNWDRLLTYRVGAWAAAVEMARDRPITGWGPGAYGAEFVPHRLEAEIRARKRYLNPLVTSSYAEAHNDYLQALAEGGAVAGAAAAGAALLLLAALARTVKRSEGLRRAEALALLALLLAGAAAALTWFPLQRPITAVPLLLAAGRAWKISGEARE